jgi:hypothetical protein
MDILGWTILCCMGNCPVHCKVFSSIPDYYPLDAIGTAPFVTPKNCEMSPGEQNHPYKKHWDNHISLPDMRGDVFQKLP